MQEQFIKRIIRHCNSCSYESCEGCEFEPDITEYYSKYIEYLAEKIKEE